jgi:hypothetical protein
MKELMWEQWVEVSGMKMMVLPLDAEIVLELNEFLWARTGIRPNTGGELVGGRDFVSRL